MQGRRSTIDSYPETFEFDRRSNSNDTVVQQQLFRNNVINPRESQLPDYLLPGNETNFTFANATSNDERRLSSWAFGESSSNPRSGNQMSHDEVKMEHGWSSLSGCGRNNFDQVNETSFCPHLYEPSGSETEQRSYAGGSINFSGAAPYSTGNMTEEVDGMPSSSLDNRRLSSKRKALEGVSGSSSIGATPSSIHQAENTIWHSPPWYNVPSGLHISSLTNNSSGVNPPEQLSRRLSVGARVASDNHSGAVGNFENSQRNLHAGGPSNLLSSGTFIRRSNTQSPYQSPSRAFPFCQSLDSRPITAGTASSVALRNIQPLQCSGGSNSRASSLSSSPLIPGEQIALQREVNSGSISANISERAMFVSDTETRNLAQDPRHWSLANGHLTGPANTAFSSRVGPSSMVPLSSAPTAISHQSPSQHPRSSSEVDSQSLFHPSGSEFGGQSRNFSPQLSGVSASSQHAVLSSGTSHLGHHQPLQGSALWTDRRMEGLIGVPLSFRPLPEGRTRLVSEIRNVLDFMRRGGESFRFEDVFFLDQSTFYGLDDSHDRHRDMRLDVDNMTYEELLALEERIGNVSTGLSEETILKSLKQRKYLSMPVESHPELEPCCICQEEYVDGEDLGVLDCGHDFHTLCIKQWLTHKNLCPICKTTALVT